MRLRKTSVYRNSALIVCPVLVALFCAAMGYFSLFSNLQASDDEGQLIQTLRNFLSGHPMYDIGGSYYGPYFYFYEWVAHALMGVPISTESARFVSLAFWITASLLSLLLTYRATGSPTIALGAQFIVFGSLAFLPENPAHPQELCFTLLPGFALASYAKNRVVSMALLGLLAGVMTATKINAGMYLAMALAISIAYTAKAQWLRRLSFLSFGAAAFPILLMWGHHSESWVQRYCLVMVVSMAAAILVVSRLELQRDLKNREILIAGSGFVAAIAVGSLFSLVHGGSIRGMVEWTIVAPRNTMATWFTPAYVRKSTLLFAIAGPILAWCAATRRIPDPLIALLKLGFACGVIFLLTIGLWHIYPETAFLIKRGSGYNMAVFFGAPFLWLGAIAGGGSEAGNREQFARAVLTLAAVIQILYAYPVAGIAQVRIAAVLVIIVAGVCLSDGLRYLYLRWPQWFRPVLGRAVAAAFGLTLVWLSFDVALDARERYQAGEPLNIAGLRRIHVPHDRAYAMRELVQRVSTHGCTKLLTLPSMFSLNLWTGTQPLTYDVTNWVTASSNATQEKLIETVSREPRTCVIYSRRLIDIWNAQALQDVSSKPVVRFIEQNYKPEFRAFVEPDFDYEFMVRDAPHD